ncbi:MAG: DUF4065 domain-containing protein [Desulfatibacillum sp.]|nr:DUF4065 domain-containing protein [Desulfatibacillum sp.]
MKHLECPNGHGIMSVMDIERTMSFRGEDITVSVPVSKCSVCGIEAGTVEQVAHAQRVVHDAYRKKKELLTSEDIQRKRKRLGWTQNTLAHKAKVGVASVKRWELGQIQSESMDALLRGVFNETDDAESFEGNRPFSLARTKLVFRTFESVLKRKLLFSGDKGLKTTKYIWYADMKAYQELGQGMTGAVYAHLPWGPQFDNYPQLFEMIHKADETLAPPLSPEEKRIINQIANKFRTNKSVFDAAHREPAWKNRKDGEKIPYSTYERLTQI